MGSGKEEEKWKKEEEKIVQFSLIFFWIEIFVIIEKFCFLYSFFSIFYNVCNILDISLSKKANFWSKLYSYDYRGKWKKGRREERWKKEGEKVVQFSLIFFFFLDRNICDTNVITKFWFLSFFFFTFYNVCNILDTFLSKKVNFWSKL